MQQALSKNAAQILLLFICTIGFFSSCQSQQKKNGNQQTKQGKLNNVTFKEGEDYLLFERARVLDKVGFSTPAEAYSVLLPKGWKYNGEVTWRQPGAGCDGTYNRFKAQSAKGDYGFEILPPTLWSWTSNEQLRQMQQPQTGGSYCSQGEPMNAEQYLRRVFGPTELGNPQIISITPNKEVVAEMQQTNDKARRELMRYGASQVNFDQTAITAIVRWADNTEGIILCGVSISEVLLPNIYNGTYDRQYTSQAAKRIVFRYPAGQKEQASKELSVIMGSYRSNPSWVAAVNTFWKNIREKRYADNIGRIKLMDDQTRAMGNKAIQNGNDRLNAMDASMRNWEAKQSADDRMHSNFIKTIREVENYRDETGKVELSGGYNHAWSRSDGSSFIMSNNPNFDPAGVLLDPNWKEMKKVD